MAMSNRFKTCTPSLVLGLTLLLGLPLISTKLEVKAQTAPESNTAPVDARSNFAILGIAFDTAVPFSKPTKIKTDTVGVLFPPSATPGNQAFMVTLRELPDSSTLFDNLSDEEISTWIRFSTVGGGRPSDGSVERIIAGRDLIGDIQFQRGRRETYSEIYVLPLSTGKRLLLTFQADTRLPLQQVETMIATVAKSMRELPPKSPEWRDSYRWWKEPKAAN